MAKALPLMIQGTSSDAGKSVLVTALCRIFTQDGFKTAPFKSQNMALNSYITVDGKEIGRSQGVQAEAAGVWATTDMNPILIKPTRENESQIVVHGEPYRNMKAGDYRREFFPIGLNLIQEAYGRLASSYERIVIEGAGSPAEINLNERELVNMRVARIANAPVILVSDIERGGVFASLVGTLQLLDQADRNRVVGVIINKFRGDLSLLQTGLDWFERQTGKPVLGVVPYIKDLYIDAEDSLILKQYPFRHDISKDIDIAVIQYPRISNFTDADPFFVEPDCLVRYVTHPQQLGEPDIILLPGSKNTIEDLMYVRESGMEQYILSLHRKGKTIFGICGGYQMLGEKIFDPYHLESPIQDIKGIGLIPMETTMNKKKTTVQSQGTLFFASQRMKVEGYEIHMGQSQITGSMDPLIEMHQGRKEGFADVRKKVFGTYFHGIFHNDDFRKIFLNDIRYAKGLLPVDDRLSYVQLRQQGYDRLADHVRQHVQVDRIQHLMNKFQCEKEGTQV